MKSILKLACLVVVLLVPIAPVQALVPGTDANGKPFPSLAPMLKRVNPAVVNISTAQTVIGSRGSAPQPQQHQRPSPGPRQGPAGTSPRPPSRR